MKKLLLFSLSLIVALTLLSGCGKEQSTNTKTTKTVTYNGQEYTVPEKPERIVTLSNSIIKILYAVDGTAVGRVESNDKLPENMEKLPTVGHTATINMETLVGLKPDLVIGLKTQHEKFASQLESNKLPSILINYDGISDNIPLIKFIGQLTNHEAKAAAVIKDYENKIDTLKKKAATYTPAKVAVLRATGKAVTAETSKSITASMVKDLGMNNVILNHKNLKEDSKTVPYSLESLAQDDPDIIFVVTMGKKEEIDKTMSKEITSNPAWSQLTAVKNNKVFYLPSNLFLLNPGLQTPEAMEILLNYAYGN